ncbi:MAG: hydantoinase B/oxoprolinase family protein [Aigarchaeota archaeon]|nr:hydantoinase B/oxoprolinase family protein [Aigarchaeota archaeon]MDW8092912.1 hydantoinase B/oxoprolinase family protein [Nitrososphaerota archaeon]
MPADLELVWKGRFKPEPPTEEEELAIAKIDPIDYAVYSRRLEMACREAREILKRLGISTFIKAGDTAQGYYCKNGDMSIAEVGTYLHVVTGIIPIKFVLKHYVNEPTVGLKDGDIFFCNEAIYGGIHNPDMITFMPVYSDGELIAWVAAASHEPETGATEPGGMPNMAKTRYDEGLKVPPIKIGENFKVRKDLIELIENNVRYPLMLTNDQMARVSTCLRLRKRILEIAEEKGNDFVKGLLRKIIVETGRVVSERIKKIPDGRYRHVAFLDTIGFAEGLIRLPVELIKEGERVVFDLSRASPQVPGPYNAFEHAVEAHLASNIFQYLLSDLPASSGCLLPFEFRTTPGSCLNPDPDAAISNTTYLCPVVINAIQIVLIKALFSNPEFRKDESIVLPLNGGLRSFTISGRNQWGRPVTNFLVVISNSRGGGARLDKDGVDSAGFWFCGYAEAADCENDESVLPLMTVWRSFAPDGGGPGKFRGGTGVSFGYLVHNTNSLLLTCIGNGNRFPITHGVFGGYPASTRPVVILRNAKEKLMKRGVWPRNDKELVKALIDEVGKDLIIVPNAHPTITLREGDLVAQCSGGSGGYGDVLERDPQSVMADLKAGKISHWAARNVYRVVYDEESLKIDWEATEIERRNERRRRLERGRPFRTFLREWEKKSPPQSALTFYGDWPVPFSSNR